MRNFEFYEKEIKKIIQQGNDIALKDNVPFACSSIDCQECDCYYMGGCDSHIIKWLYLEYGEQPKKPKKPKINKHTKMFLEALETGYIAADSDGNLSYFYEKPYKTDDGIWDELGTWVDLSAFPFLSLDFITWGDEEPWSVEDLRKLEVFDN